MRLKQFVIYITIILTSLFYSCNKRPYNVSAIHSTRITLAHPIENTQAIDSFISPYKKHIEKDLYSVLAHSKDTYSKKTTTYSTQIGNFIADATHTQAQKYHKKLIDFTLLNHGGIRTEIPKGAITLKKVYEIMPFENKIVLLKLDAAQIMRMAQFIKKDKKAHPVSKALQIIYKNKDVLITINGKALRAKKTYTIATSDYLANGGDNMFFLQKHIKKIDTKYRIRDAIIDYLKTIDTIQPDTTKRIIKIP